MYQKIFEINLEWLLSHLKCSGQLDMIWMFFNVREIWRCFQILW